MTRDDIIRMARDAGVADGIELTHEITAIEIFSELVAAAEREACAQVIVNLFGGESTTSAAIRERGQG